MKFVATNFIALLLCGCASTDSIVEHSNISAVPTSAEYSGWDIDHCADAINEKVECISHGGQIYIVNLKSVKGFNLHQLLVVQHALLIPKDNKGRWCFTIESASENLVEATGVTHIASEYKRGC